MTNSQYLYEIRPRKDKRGVDLIADALPFGRLWYREPDDAIGYAKFRRALTPCRDSRLRRSEATRLKRTSNVASSKSGGTKEKAGPTLKRDG